MVDHLHFLSAFERERVRAAIDEARKSTAAKFEFVAVAASDHYAFYPVVWAGIVALVATGLLSALRPALGIGAGFLVNAFLFVVLGLVFDWWPLRVRLVPRAAKRIAGSRMAHREFAANVMSRDNERNGVMLFVSLSEHHLEIIAERDVYARVPVGTWDRIVADATRAMGGRGTAEGLIVAITACGQLLAAAFPKAGA